MDMELKRGLRTKLLKYSEMYGLDDLVPAADTDGKDRGGAKEGWGFVRSWGWRATLSAQDVGVVVGAILEVGKKAVTLANGGYDRREAKETTDEDGTLEAEEWIGRFWDAYDALEKYLPLFDSVAAIELTDATESKSLKLPSQQHSISTVLSFELVPLSLKSVKSATSVLSACAS